MVSNRVRLGVVGFDTPLGGGPRPRTRDQTELLPHREDLCDDASVPAGDSAARDGGARHD
jgi:hypothetical protein